MYRRQQAFTLLELLVALALLGILLALATPAFGKLAQHNRDQALRNLLQSHLQYARAQAVMTKRQRWLCGSSDGISCNGDWASHWLLVTADASKTLQQHQLPAGNGLCWRGFNQDIRFQSNGTTPISNGRFDLCRGGKTVWALTINRQGRVRDSSTDTATNCCQTDHTNT